ncbi:hypothetical protein ACHAXS_008108 [Conticribra weissflogii]
MTAADQPPPQHCNNQSHHTNHFQTRKNNCLSKRDKSSAGRIDPRAVDICAAINERREYYTTSSCSGRCFLYVGDGIKSWHATGSVSGEDIGEEGDGGGTVVAGGSGTPDGLATTNDHAAATGKLGFFQRYRVNHDLILEPCRYFDISTLEEDPTGGGDPIPTVGQYDYFKSTATGNGGSGVHEEGGHDNMNATNHNGIDRLNGSEQMNGNIEHGKNGDCYSKRPFVPVSPLWLRYEPFILHVMCQSLNAASELMNLARPSFKNVGLTTWSGSEKEINAIPDVDNVASPDDYPRKSNQQCKGGGPRYLVAIWGDEGLDMPLSLPTAPGVGIFYNGDEITEKNAEWLAQLVNERHVRNWRKIERFVEAVRKFNEMDECDELAHPGIDADEHDDIDDYDGVNQSLDGVMNRNDNNSKSKSNSNLHVRSYDVVGDVAILNSLPENVSEQSIQHLGESILTRNKGIKICLARTTSLSTTNRSPGSSGLIQIAGPKRAQFITSHYEYGIKCVVDLSHTFFSPRMAPERLRLSQQVARGERVLVVFAGVGMEALQIVARTEASEVLAIEKNEVAVECLRRAKRMLERNKTVTCPGGGKGAMERLHIVEGDALEILPTLEEGSFDRIVAPRPKEGSSDGDLGTGDAGTVFLLAMLPLVKLKGEVHWYDFAADHELPTCERTRETVKGVCDKCGLDMEVIRVAKVGSVAKRQLRICMDFRITGINKK